MRCILTLKTKAQVLEASVGLLFGTLFLNKQKKSQLSQKNRDVLRHGHGVVNKGQRSLR